MKTVIKTVDDFRGKEEIMREITYSTFGGFCSYFEKSFKIYMSGIGYFDKKDWHTYRWEKRFCIILFVKLASTLKCSYELCVSGNHTESIMLTRQIYEAIIRIMFIKKFPDEAEDLVKRFNITKGAQRLGIKYSSLYYLMSEFTHGHKLDVAFDLVGIQQGKLKGIKIGPQNPKNNLDNFAPAMNTLMFYFWVCLALLVNVLPELNSTVEWKSQYDSHMRDLENKYIRTFVNRKGEPNSLALKGADEILNVIQRLPSW